jgi:ABC-type transporter Mla maintaining outer membrane lipid asymmetry permease subunit MlaE
MSRAARREILLSLRNNLILGLILGLIWGLILGLIGGLILGLIWGLIGGLIWGLIWSGLTEAFSQTIQERSHPNQGIINSAKNSLFTMIGSLVLCALIYLGLPLVSGMLDPESVESLVAALLPMPIIFGFLFGGGMPLRDI